MPVWIEGYAQIRGRPAPAASRDGSARDGADDDEVDELNEFRKYGAKLRRAQYLEVRGGLTRTDHVLQAVSSFGAKFREAYNGACDACKDALGLKLEEYEAIANEEFSGADGLSQSDQECLEDDSSDFAAIIAEEAGDDGPRGGTGDN